MVVTIFMVLGRAQPEKLAIEVRVPSRSHTSYYLITQAMWNFIRIICRMQADAPYPFLSLVPTPSVPYCLSSILFWDVPKW